MLKFKIRTVFLGRDYVPNPKTPCISNNSRYFHESLFCRIFFSFCGKSLFGNLQIYQLQLPHQSAEKYTSSMKINSEQLFCFFFIDFLIQYLRTYFILSIFPLLYIAFSIQNKMKTTYNVGYGSIRKNHVEIKARFKRCHFCERLCIWSKMVSYY